MPTPDVGSAGQEVDRSAKRAETARQIILHPILFAVYPALGLYSANMAMLEFSAVLVPALVLAVIAGLLWMVLARVMGDFKIAAITTSVPLLVFFSHGALERLVRPSGLAAWILAITALLVAGFVVVLAVVKWRGLLDPANYFFNVVSLVLVAAPLVLAAFWNYDAVIARHLLPDRAEFDAEPSQGEVSPGARDVYYLVLDGYGRDDVLRTIYGFDNSPFLSDLRERGFYVADEAVANYPTTLVSLASTLNLGYANELVGESLGEFSDRRFLRELMRDNRAKRLLRKAGYSIVSFSSEYIEVQMGAVDVEMREWWFPSMFVLTLAEMTPIRAILDALNYPLDYDLHRYRTLYPFERMPEAIAVQGPKFVFAHIYYGHPPFVLGPNGEDVAGRWNYSWGDGSRLLGEDNELRQEYIDGYRSQVGYLNERLLDTIDEILRGSEQTPIIVIHGDHGPGSRFDSESLENTDVRERYSIFYAALLPDGGTHEIYPSISPVNGLRVVFNRYLGTNYPLLEDMSFFTTYLKPYRYFPVDDDRLRPPY